MELLKLQMSHLKQIILSNEQKENLKNDLKIFFKILLMSDNIKSEIQFTSVTI